MSQLVNDISLDYVCPICQSQNSVLKVVLIGCRDLLCGCPGEWSLLKCSRCEVVFTVPPPTDQEIPLYYPAQYAVYNPTKPIGNSLIGNIIRLLVMWPYHLRYGSRDWDIRPFGSGRLLDVGCGAGRFLKLVSDLGWSCSGIDLSPFAVEESRRHVPQAQIFECQLEDLPDQGPFDTIVMSHVLEHLPRPMQTLHRCVSLLAPGGKLYISLPNIESWEARFFGKYWAGLDVPRHLIHFPEMALTRLLVDLGFTVETRVAMFVSYFSDSPILALPDSLRHRILGTRWARYLYFGMIFPASLSYLLGNRGVITFLASKPN